MEIREQAVLFGLPYETEEEQSITDRYLHWINSPEGSSALKMFENHALDAFDAGVKKIGAKAIWERMRWSFQVEKRLGDEFKLNNNFTSRIARTAATRHPALAEMFEFRKLRSK